MEEEREIEIIEKIDLNKDPIIQLVIWHIKAGLSSFINPNTTPETAYQKYKILLSIASKFLKLSSGEVDVNNLNEEDKKIKEIVDIMLRRERKIKINLII